MAKLNLVIDASSIFYRTVFTVGNYETKKGEKLLDNRKSQGVFMRKLATDLSALVRNVEEPARTIMCLDSSSWRKSIDIVDGGYKEDREKKREESPVNWKAFHELTDNFSVILSTKGYISSKIPGAEGDDLLYLWSVKLNDMGENVILITGDRDLLQTLKKHKNGSWTIALDPNVARRKISLTQETLDYSTDNGEVNIFDTDSWSSSSNILDKLVKTHDINIVDTERIKTMKVVMGDGGDAVPSVVTWKDEKSKKNPGAIRSMTESNFSKIVDYAPALSTASWKELRDGKFVEEISTVMESLKKIKVDREVVMYNLYRNSKLVILSEETIPHQIRASFEKEHEHVPDVLPVTSRDAILNGTEWWTSDKTAFVPKSYDLF